MRVEAQRGAGGLVAGLLVYYAFVSSGYLYATRVSGAWPWPFSRATDTVAALVRLASYLPVLACSVLALAFVRASGESVTRLYARTRFDRRAALVLAGCVGYASFMLAQHRAPFAVPGAWAALLVLCAMNAFAEETLYRGTFPAVISVATTSLTWRRVLPSVAYAAPHLAISVPLAGFALAFGMVLGWVREGRGGLWACIVCHFIADVGAIGLPFLPDGR